MLTSRLFQVRHLLALTVLASSGVAPLQAQSLSWTGTAQFSQGKYIFTETTRSYSLYSSLNWQGDRLRLSVGIPVVLQDSRAVTYVGDLALPTGGPDSDAVARRTKGQPVPMGGGGQGPGGSAEVWQVLDAYVPIARQTTDPPGDSVQAPGSLELQMADPVLSGGFRLIRPSAGFLGLDLTTALKLPLRDVDSGVGTGQVDFGLGLSSAASRGRLMLFGDVGWWRYGDLPELELNDVVTYGAGLGMLLGSRVSGLLSLSGSTAIMDQVSAPAQLDGLVSLSLGSGRSLTLGAGVGLTEASPDFSVSLGSRVTLRN